MAEAQFVSDSCSVEQFILGQENNSTLQKTQRDVNLLESFLRTKYEERKIENIPAVELNEYICQFIISVRTKDAWQRIRANFEIHKSVKPINETFCTI